MDRCRGWHIFHLSVFGMRGRRLNPGKGGKDYPAPSELLDADCLLPVGSITVSYSQISGS